MPTSDEEKEKKKGFLLHLNVDKTQNENLVVPIQVQQILNTYGDVISKPKALSLGRAHDHKIPLQSN